MSKLIRVPISIRLPERLLKRGIVGVYHSVSKQHLDKYCDEFSFRWNRREITDGERTEDAIKNAQGKRLIYQV